MKIDYDQRVDAAYIHLDPSTATKASKTFACDPEAVGGQIQLDFDDAGHLIGVEVLNASRMLPKALLKAETSTQ